MYATNYFEEKMLNLMHGYNISAPEKLYLELFLTDPGDAGTGGTPISYSGYARQEIFSVNRLLMVTVWRFLTRNRSTLPNLRSMQVGSFALVYMMHKSAGICCFMQCLTLRLLSMLMYHRYSGPMLSNGHGAAISAHTCETLS